MKKTLSLILLFVLILALAACGAAEPAPDEANGEAASTVSDQSQTNDDSQSPQTSSDSTTLPASYPKDILPLAVDAEIIDVRESPASKGLEVMYVSDNDIGTLRDFYEGALKDAPDLDTMETADGYMISANMDGVGYNIMLSEDAMNPNPQYAGKKSVYLMLSGLE